MTGLSCTCCKDYEYVIIFLSFSGATLFMWVGVSLGSSSRSGVKQVSLSSILSCAMLYDLHCTRSVQFGVIVPSLMNVTVEIYYQTSHKIDVRHYKLLSLVPELLILNWMVSVQDISLHMIGVTNWVVQIYFLVILYLMHKQDIPMCGNFRRNICCCAYKLFYRSYPIII